MSRIEASEVMVAKVVGEVALSGVIPKKISSEILGLSIEDEAVLLFESAVDWLSSESVITVHTQYKGEVSNIYTATLTSYGFALLSQNFGDGLKLGTALQKVRSTGHGFSGLGEFLGGVLCGFTKTLSN